MLLVSLRAGTPVPLVPRLALAALVSGLAVGGVAAAPAPAGEPAGAPRVAKAAPHASSRAIAHYLEARRLAREGDPGRAAAELRQAVAHDGASPELRLALAEALADAGRLDDAEREARAVLELDRRGPTASEALVLLGRIAAARGDREAAILSLRQAAQLEAATAAAGGEADPAPWRLLAQLYVEGGDEAAAARALEDGARSVPGDGSGFRELGRSALERREPGRAERHLARAAELDPRDADVHRLLAAAHEALGRSGEAREDHLAVLARDPDDAGAPLALGRLALAEGDVTAAREWLARHVRAAPDPAAAQVRVAFVWLAAGRPAEALAAARERRDVPDARLLLAEGLALQALGRHAESIAPLEAIPASATEALVPGRVALSEALSRAGRHADAERALAAPLAARPGDVRLLAARAAALERAGRGAEADALLAAAARDKERAGQGDDAADLHQARADTLLRAGRSTAAVAVLREALSVRPRDEGLHYALGYALERAGQPDAAVAQMRALLALAPDHAEALNFVAYAYAERGERLDEAERLVRRALELEPGAAHVLDSLGWILLRRGEHARAVEVLERAVARGGRDAVVLEHLGDAYRAAGRPADAAGAYRRALAVEAEGGPEPGAAPRRPAVERKLREIETARAPIPLTPSAARR
jgi:Flp pilus assembly protein TadD